MILASTLGSTGSPLKVLIVNAFFDDLRRDSKNPYKIPQATAPLHLAGLFNPQVSEVRLYNEHTSGPMTDKRLLQWPDLLILTGLNVAFDRMLHITAYVRTLKPDVIVVAGGHAVRAMPIRSSRFFDYVLQGDVESLSPLLESLYGQNVLCDDPLPRYDLQQTNRWLGYVESTRNCNFSCSFCTLTGEGNKPFDLELPLLRKQILAMGRRRHVGFLDNNFYSSGKASFARKMELLIELREAGHFDHWSAMVTNDFFLDSANLELAKKAGCVLLFSGVETFDTDVLEGVGKKQNMALPQLEVIRRCLEAGIVFIYGLIFDLSSRYVRDMRSEIDVILETPNISLPSYMSFTIPLIGTPYFEQCIQGKKILPSAKLRDMDGFTMTVEPLDEFDEALRFMKELPSLRGYRARVLTKALRLVARYRKDMTPFQRVLLSSSAALLTAPNVINSPLSWRPRTMKRTHVTTTEPVDPLYEPMFRVDQRHADYFKPSFVTDGEGNLAEDMLIDYEADGSRVLGKGSEFERDESGTAGRQSLIVPSNQ